MRLVGIVGFVAAVSSVGAQTTRSIDGEWIGGFRFADATRYLELHARGQQVEFDLPLERQGGPARVTTLGDSGVSLEMTIAGRTFDAKLTWTADGLAGTIGSVNSRVPITLLHIAPFNLARFAELSGNYELNPGHTVSIGQIHDVMNLPVFYDHVTRREGLLFPLSDSTYVSGTSLGVSYPVDLRITTVRDAAGVLNGLRWHEGKRAPALARRLRNVKREEVTIRSGRVSLAATLWLPTSPEKHPAMVNVMGPSGAGARGLAETALFFAHHGVAVLEYDKRGAGKSTGNWQSATMDDLAGDARAALAFLAARSDIDSKRLGLWGTSNGAWVVPMVAAAPSPVSFVIVRSVPALSANENVLFEVERDLRAEGFSDAEIQRGLSFRRMLSRVVTTNSGFDTLADAIRSESNTRLLDASRTPKGMAGMLVPLDSVWYRSFHDMVAFDPIPYWKRVTVPVLAFVGGRDRSLPAARTRSMMESAFRESGNRRASVVFLPTANHIMFETDENDPFTGAHRDTSPLNSHQVAGYHDAIAAWLKTNVLARR